MDAPEPKKLALLRILNILEDHSDYYHPLRQEDILRYLEEEYKIVIERKAVARNLSLLKEAGYKIMSRREGSYLDYRAFTDAELRLLIDAVLSSKHVSAEFSKDLIERLCGLSNEYFKSHVDHVRSFADWDRTDNNALLYNIEIVDEAIGSKNRIRFDYNKYGADKKMHKTATHVASPYQLILHNQRYYLMARNEKWGNMAFFRLDRITNMSIVDEKLTPITKNAGYERGINYKELSTALPYMYTDKPERVDFIAEDHIIDQIIDWFGKDVRINPEEEGKVKVSLIVSPNAMEHWALQYAGYVRVVYPQPLVDGIKDRLAKAEKEYEN